jgi:hypothetical protein
MAGTSEPINETSGLAGIRTGIYKTELTPPPGQSRQTDVLTGSGTFDDRGNPTPTKDTPQSAWKPYPCEIIPCMTRSVRQVEQFIAAELRKKIQRDFNRLKMVKEADLECCVYYHFRKFFSSDRRWRMLARKHSKLTGHYVDFLIFREIKSEIQPKFAIELKWNAATMSPKDRRSLCRCVEQLHVHKAYFITTHYAKKDFNKMVKTDATEKHHIFEIVIILPYVDGQKAEWKKRRRAYMYSLPRKRKGDGKKKAA